MELYNNSLKFYQGRIYEILGSNDSRLKIRILPFMDTETYNVDLLPAFPPLFKGTILNGFSEKIDGKEKAENVLVLCNENFTFGWVVCKANVFSTNNPSIDYSIETQNFGYDETKKRIEHTNFDQIIPDSDYENLVIQTLVFEDKNDSNKQGGLCEFYNYRTGDKFILHSSGNGMAITATGIKLFTGDQVNVSELKDGKCSSIMIRPDEITFTAQKVEFNAIHIGLGKGCRKVVTTTQSQPTYAEGSPFLPIGKTRGGSDLTAELTVEA